MPTVSERLEIVREAIAAAAERSGRASSDVALVAVSKSHPPEALHAVLAAGHSLFGESRVQEAKAKIPLLPGRARWHFIGHLQRNKLRQALPLFELLHGVDSLELTRDIDRIADEVGTSPQVLLEVNVAGESSKFGFAPEKLRAQMEELLAFRRVTIAGLMCIPPPAPGAEGTRKFFVMLRELRDALHEEFCVGLPHLSMGMSNDYPVAVEEGATLVRVGSAIFGERSGQTWKPVTEAGFE